MIRLLEQTARREGFGDRLAEGSWRLAREIGRGAERLPYAVKGLELPAHSARALKGMSIGYATATRGGSHHDTRPTPQYAPGFDRRSTEDKPAFAATSQHFTAVDDSLVMCRFTSERGFGLFLNDAYAGLLSAVTGWTVDVPELERIGERIVNLERLFNVREGVRRKDDVLPWKVMHEPIPDGPVGGHALPARGARRDARRLLRAARLGRRRRADAGAPDRPRPRRRPGRVRGRASRPPTPGAALAAGRRRR